MFVLVPWQVFQHALDACTVVPLTYFAFVLHLLVAQTIHSGDDRLMFIRMKLSAVFTSCIKAQKFAIIFAFVM